jgi:hypothetical protein
MVLEVEHTSMKFIAGYGAAGKGCVVISRQTRKELAGWRSYELYNAT